MRILHTQQNAFLAAAVDEKAILVYNSLLVIYVNVR